MTEQSQDGKKNIVIIGGGIIGCTSAYYLTRHPQFDPSKHTITLLEASSIAGGASGKAGGLLGLWAYPSSLVPLSYRLHRELAEEHGGAERWGYRAVHCAQVDCIGKKAEKVTNNGEPKQENANISLQKRTKEALGKLRAAGVPKELDWIDPEALRLYDEMGTPATTAQVHPFQFTTAMAELACEAGVDILTNCPVEKINYTADGKAVSSVTYTSTSSSGTKEQHTLPSNQVVLAAGPWTQRPPPLSPDRRPPRPQRSNQTLPPRQRVLPLHRHQTPLRWQIEIPNRNPRNLRPPQQPSLRLRRRRPPRAPAFPLLRRQRRRSAMRRYRRAGRFYIR